MPTTQKSQQTANFDPQALSTYQGLQGGLGQLLQGYMNNPFGNPFFQTQQQLGTRQAQNLSGTSTSNLLRNMTASNMFGGASSPAGTEMLQNQGRANTGLQANLGFLNPVQNALGLQTWAGGLANQYRPLQTGQQTTQSTGGLGTWLPQVIGAGLGAATGGMSSLFGGISPMMHQFGGSAPGLTGSGSGGFAGLPTNFPGSSGGNPFGSQPGSFWGGGGGAPPPPGGGGCCWVATELYGSRTAPETLAIFNWLESTPSMAAFLKLYRKIGPAWAKWIRRNKALRRATKWLFDGFLAAARRRIYENLECNSGICTIDALRLGWLQAPSQTGLWHLQYRIML